MDMWITGKIGPGQVRREFMESVGRDHASELWRQYPILDYGKKWDL